MKKILHISKYYYPFRGGTEQVAQDCVNALKDKYKQMVICFNDCNEDRLDIIDGVKVIRCGTFAKVSSQGLSLNYGKRLKSVFDKFSPDIIVFHYPNPFVAMYLLRYIPVNCKLIVYWHLDIVKQKRIGKLFERQNRKLIRRADQLIATSPNYVKGSPWLSSAENKCIVVPNCIDAERLQSSPEIISIAKEIRKKNIDKIICLAVGRHTEYKGFKYLIQAAHLLGDKYQIYIIGKGEETERLKKEAGEDKKIHFLGQIDDNELKGYFTAMDIFCFPSITKNEAFGIALAEAMYYEKPAVTFNIPGSGVNYVSIDGETGIEIDNCDIEKYAGAIECLGENAELRKQYGKAGKQRVESNFMYSQFQKNIISIIEAL